MRWIKDSVHGDITLTPTVNAVLDTHDMQRLRRVSQTSFVNLTYPGANHTRLEHSLGTYHLTAKACAFLEMKHETSETMALAGLLHDVGHPAFSHALEGLIEEHTKKDHEHMTEERILDGPIKDALEANGIAPKDIITAYHSPAGKIISGELGTDRMDYLLRDSLYTGVGYGTIDTDRILRMLRFVNGQLVLDEKGLSAAESLLLARFHMFPAVYNNSQTMIARKMMEKAVEHAIEDKHVRAADLFVMDDWELVAKLKTIDGFVSRTVRDVLDRKLYRYAFQRRIKEFSKWLYLGGLKTQERKAIEEEIAKKAGVSVNEVVFFVPRPWFKDIDINVYRAGDFYSIGELSLISRVLKEAQWDYSYVTVYCPQAHCDAVGKAAAEVLAKW